jgi:hypothetical protein
MPLGGLVLKKSKTIGSLTLCSLAVALCGAGQSALAHTSFKDKAEEGKTAYTAIQIGHTCETPKGKKIPVIAQSVVFPTVNPIVTRPDPSDPTKTLTDLQLSDVISDPLGLAGKASLFQDRSIFKRQDVTTDAAGNVIAFHGTHGNLQANLRGLVPLRFTAPTIVPTSCARSVLVKVAVADICKRDVFPPKPGTANLWIPHATATFSDGTLDGSSSSFLGGSPASLTITRTSPLPADCPVDAKDGKPGYDVTVWPSDEDVNAHLPIKGYWGR